MPSTRPHGALDIELLTTGPNAYGYGRLADTRDFAFRVRNRKARLEIYRVGADHAEPAQADVELVAERPIGAIRLDSPRSLTTMVRNMVGQAADAADAPQEPDPDERTLRAYFVRMDAILATWTSEHDAETAAEHDRAEVTDASRESLEPPAPARRSLRDFLRRHVA